MDMRYLYLIGNVVVSDGQEGCPQLTMHQQLDLVQKYRYFLSEVEAAKQLAPCKLSTQPLTLVYY
jgi:hypothetical protein